MALLACAVLGQLGDLADQELMARAGLALVCALGLQCAREDFMSAFQGGFGCSLFPYVLEFQ